MGCITSTLQTNTPVRRNRKAIEAEIEYQRSLMKSEVKMLLLGAGESGKSTFCKQLRLIHKGGYTEEERSYFRQVLYVNIITAMQAVLKGLTTLERELQPENQEFANFISSRHTSIRTEDLKNAGLDRRVPVAIAALWTDAAVTDVVYYNALFQINDSAGYLFDGVSRILDPACEPTDADILRARVRTVGITETRITIGKLNYRILDVGGQRSERKKWIHCFEAVDVLLFLVAVSEYDQTLFEDETASRLNEALMLFESTSNSRWFSNSTVVLLFNKIDLLEAKLSKSSLRAMMPSYIGDDLSFHSALEFFQQSFTSVYRQERPLYHHFITATDTRIIRKVTFSVSESILKSMCGKSAML